jgi:hypothetical protein
MRRLACAGVVAFSLSVVFTRVRNAKASRLQVSPALSLSPQARAAKWPADGPRPVVQAEIMRNLVALRREAARLNALTDQILLSGSRGQSWRKEAAKARQAVADTADKAAALTMLIATMSYVSKVSRGESEALLEVFAVDSAAAVACLTSAATVRATAAAETAEMPAGQAAGGEPAATVPVPARDGPVVGTGLERAVAAGQATGEDSEEPAATVSACNELEAGQQPGSAVRMVAGLVSLTATAASAAATSASDRLRAAGRDAQWLAGYCHLRTRQRTTLSQLEQGVLAVVKSAVAAETQRADLVSVLARVSGRGRAA